MTSTSFSIGFGESKKSSSKVLKPPGGGSSDLFGSETPATPRSGVKNRMQSNIFAGDATKSANGEVRRTAPVDSHNRLFGDLQRPYTPAKNHMKSNLPIAQVDEPDTKQMNGNGKMNGHHNGNTNGNHQVATNGHTNGHSNGHSEQQNGNPVTGEGYKTNGHAEINTTVPALNTGHHVINKNRIPPGGFSSGLW